MIGQELKLLIPSLLGFRYVLCVENDSTPDIRIRRVRKTPISKVIHSTGTFRYKVTEEYEYRAKLDEVRHPLSEDGVLIRAYDNSVKWYWKPFCPFGIGKNFPLFTQYLAKQLAG